MSARLALLVTEVDVLEFRCPLSDGATGRCHLFERAPDPASTLRVTCRYLLTRNQVRCLLGDAKTRRDHLA